MSHEYQALVGLVGSLHTQRVAQTRCGVYIIQLSGARSKIERASVRLAEKHSESRVYVVLNPEPGVVAVHPTRKAAPPGARPGLLAT